MLTQVYDGVFSADYSGGYFVGSAKAFDGSNADFNGNGVIIGFIE